jgi:hypothetical protein
MVRPHAEIKESGSAMQQDLSVGVAGSEKEERRVVCGA